MPSPKPRHLRRLVSNVGVPCGCAECIEAGVAQEPQRRVPGVGRPAIWLHGWRLRHWLDAAEQAFADARARLRP